MLDEYLKLNWTTNINLILIKALNLIYLKIRIVWLNIVQSFKLNYYKLKRSLRYIINFERKNRNGPIYEKRPHKRGIYNSAFFGDIWNEKGCNWQNSKDHSIRRD